VSWTPTNSENSRCVALNVLKNFDFISAKVRNFISNSIFSNYICLRREKQTNLCEATKFEIVPLY
jgi:hypothetical protein